jgi:exportin-T
MELCVRYSQFFEENPSFILPVLENFVRFMHSSHARVKTQSWYLFLRYVRAVKNRVGEVSQTIINAIGDLLNIKAVLSEDREDEDDEDDITVSSGDGINDTVFNSQLNIFEAIGCIASSPSVPVQSKANVAQSVIKPLFADMERNIGAAKADDQRAIVQIHHDIMALGTLAKGFSDWIPGAKGGAPPPNELSEEFVTASEATMAALETLSDAAIIRQASRFCFARLIGVLGSRVLQQLPRWIGGLLAESSNKEEMSYFLRLLEQVVFSFKADIFSILDVVLTPLLQRIFERLGEEPGGTDDELQLEELRREFLNFVLQILTPETAGVFISSSRSPFQLSVGVCANRGSRQPGNLRNPHQRPRGFRPQRFRPVRRQTRLHNPHPDDLNLGRS